MMYQRINRRHLLGLAGLSAIGVGLAACAPSSQSAAEAGTFPPEKIDSLSRLSDSEAYQLWYDAGKSTPSTSMATPSTEQDFIQSYKNWDMQWFNTNFGLQTSVVKSQQLYHYAFRDAPAVRPRPLQPRKSADDVVPTGMLSIYTYLLQDDFDLNIAQVMESAKRSLSSREVQKVGELGLVGSGYRGVGKRFLITAMYEQPDESGAVAILGKVGELAEQSGILSR